MPFSEPHDAIGRVVPHDEKMIDGSSILVRHIHPEYHVIFDANTGSVRISSGAFSATTGDPHRGMSVDMGQLLSEAGLLLGAQVAAGSGAVEIVVGDVRALHLAVGSDPTAANWFHGQVWGVKTSHRAKLHRIVVSAGNFRPRNRPNEGMRSGGSGFSASRMEKGCLKAVS